MENLTYKTIVGDAPDPGDMEEDEIYLESWDDGLPDRVVMLCPCGCRKLLELNLDPAMRPVWQATVIDGLLTLTPSINILTGCLSHFWIRGGVVQWET